jgi:hypothetical protein
VNPIAFDALLYHGPELRVDDGRVLTVMLDALVHDLPGSLKTGWRTTLSPFWN